MTDRLNERIYREFLELDSIDEPRLEAVRRAILVEGVFDVTLTDGQIIALGDKDGTALLDLLNRLPISAFSCAESAGL